MAADEFKALTVVHLPFLGRDGKTFAAGAKITREQFDKNAEGAEAANPDADNLTSQEQIDYFIEWGTLSDDMDAELHPDHRPVDPRQPTLASLIEQARTLRASLEEKGLDVPDELVKLADTNHQVVVSGESGRGGDAQ